jgi:ABC-type transport system substrate-binding protein
VRDFSSFLNHIIYLNTNKKPLSDPALRKMLAGAINRDSLVTEVYGPYAKPSSSTYPSASLDPALAPVAYPPSETTAAAGAGSKLTFAYTADDSGVHRRLAELVQQRLDAAGFSVTIKEVQLPHVFEYVNDLPAAPDMVMQTNTPGRGPPRHVGADRVVLNGRPELPRVQEPAGRQATRPGLGDHRQGHRRPFAW